MAENQKVDLSTLPKGLTKEEFTALPNFKKIRSFFTWAGVVSIVSGIFVLSSIGHISQSILQNGGSLDGLFQMGAVKLNLLFMVVSIVLGILLIKKKTTTMAYILAIIELIYVLLAITSGCLSAVFASLTSILGKIGIEGLNSNLGTAIRTAVVLLMAWIMVFAKGKQKEIGRIDRRELGFICLSGLATGGSWLCYYKALQDGLASVVVPIDKLSILVTIAFSYLVFHEKLTKRAAIGLVLIVAGTLLMIL